MLGFRGCRLAIAYPEIAEMQARAIFEAAVEAQKTTGSAVVPEIMMPLVVTRAELDLVKERIDAMAAAVAKRDRHARVEYQVGTMIELPRACLVARRDRRDGRVLLLRHQRPDPDDARHLARRRRDLPRHLYRRRASCRPTPSSPSTRTASASWCGSASSAGAGRGPTSSSASAASTAAIRPRCGSASEVGLDYVSCSPYRVPIARLAAAQAALGGKVASQA